PHERCRITTTRSKWVCMVKAFGDFEFDDERRRLTTGGRRVRLGGQAVELLCLLLDRPGELVPREEIRRRLWPESHVEFDHSLDPVVSRLRTALGDQSVNPRYIETISRKGYRFIEPLAAPPEAERRDERLHWRRRLATYFAVAILAAAIAVFFVRTRYDRFVPSQRSQTLPLPR